MTYRQIASDENIKLCVDCLRGDVCVAGVKSEVDIKRATVHWRDRKVTHPGLRNFLKLSATIRYGLESPTPAWFILWSQNSYAYHRAREHYGVLLGKHLSRNDRAAALASMLTIQPKPQPAYQWAKEVLR